ncbi:MAG TPA: hypothetical protein VGL42_08730 [Opitutaceae bacterium]|jgi:hypothetical protein
MQSEEEVDSATIAYLLDQMTPAERLHWEARLEGEPALAEHQRITSEAWAAEMLRTAPPQELTHSELGRMRMMVLATALSSEPAAVHTRTNLWPWVWPAAAVLLAGLNLAQWVKHRPAPPIESVAPIPTAASERPPFQRVIYAEPAALRKEGVNAAATLTLTETITLRETITLQPTALGTEPASGHAWFDTSRHQGLLELHHVPAPPAGSVLVLWVKPRNASIFLAVGPIPTQFYGSSGTATYGEPSLRQAPTQVMITLEHAGPAPAAPSPAVILRGP